MRPADRDAALLWDMLQACHDIRIFTQHVGLKKFIGDRKLCLAVERSLEILGEAAGRVSTAFCRAHPEIPWKQIKGLRNIIAHEYGRIDHSIIHRTVTDDIPKLLPVLKSFLIENKESDA